MGWDSESTLGTELFAANPEKLADTATILHHRLVEERISNDKRPADMYQRFAQPVHLANDKVLARTGDLIGSGS